MGNLTLLSDAPVLNLQLLLDGILVGAVFALVAYGMALVWGVMKLINVAQGEFVLLGGYVVFFLVRAGMPPLPAVPIAAAVMAIVCWALYRVVIFRIVEKDLFTSILATFGLSILIQQLINQLFGSDVRTVESGLGSLFFAHGMVTVAEVKLVAFVGAGLLGALLVWFLRQHRLGQAIRATAQNTRAARILGVDTDRVYAATFAINGAICGAAGGLVAMTWTIHPYSGLSYTVRSFMIVVVAGLGNLAGVIASGAGLGVAENYAGFLLGAEYQTAFVFSLLVVILVGRNLWLMRQRKYLK
ncbi:MAG TPA: branched-chain amino acid ABC transporter permease [Burkholderiaceae bacterium]|nr:branched-chain amino acid ABC transporter permease [Burkholderiaceae bacterium]